MKVRKAGTTAIGTTKKASPGAAAHQGTEWPVQKGEQGRQEQSLQRAQGRQDHTELVAPGEGRGVSLLELL